jgi:nicotinamidase-related amidase
MKENIQNTVLMVMDMQEGILANFAGADALIKNVSKAIAHARENKIPVIYVVVSFRNGAPEISKNNKGFAAAKQRFAGADTTAFMKVHNDIAPAENEMIIIKRRVSAFTGSDLEVVLRAFEIKHLVLTGIATSGVVLSTVREAADKDYVITILSDGCADADEEVHRVLITKIFPRQAEVVSIDDWSKNF